MRLADVENPIILGQIERTVPPRLVVSIDEDNPKYDIFGSFIASNDEYYVFGDHVIHIDNVAQYFEEYLNADYKVKK